MQQVGREEILDEDIFLYVDMLLERKRFLYDRRLSPLLYEFFLRSAKTFNWSKEDFLNKYINFKNNVRKIRFKKLDKNVQGEMNHTDKAIYVDKGFLAKIKKTDNWNEFLDNFYHECTHATDYKVRNGKIIVNGLYEIEKGLRKNDNEEENENLDTMLNEYGNIICAYLVSSNKGLYTSNTSSLPNLRSYQNLHIPGTIFCTAFDTSEKTIANLKDKGRAEFNKYFKEKYPYINTDIIIESFRDNFNIIYNSVNNKDRENTLLGYKSILDISNEVISSRINNAYTTTHSEEFIQRTYFDLEKMQALIESIKSTYDISEEDIKLQRENFEKTFYNLYFYKKFRDNKDKISDSDQQKIIDDVIQQKHLNVNLLKKYIGEEYDNKIDYNLKQIANQFYSELTKPLHDNNELTQYLKRTFKKPTIKQRLENFKNKFIKTETLLIPTPQLNENQEKKQFKSYLQAEIDTVITIEDKVMKQQGKEETER